MIRTKSTDDPISSRDGFRIFVTRYWPRGHSRDECEEWIPALAPSETLLKRIQCGEVTWTEFEREYKSEILKGYFDESTRNPRMRNSGQKYFLRMLSVISQKTPITLICSCGSNETNCHRHLLKSLILALSKK